MQDASVQGRVEVWEGAAASTVERPLLGKGPGTFERREPGNPVRPRASHNIFVEVLAEMGAIGLATYAWVLAAALRALHVARRGAAVRLRDASFGLEAALLAFLTASLALSAPFQSVLFVFVGLSLALARIAATTVANATAVSGRG
jgi:O-antigen ligase